MCWFVMIVWCDKRITHFHSVIRLDSRRGPISSTVNSSQDIEIHAFVFPDTSAGDNLRILAPRTVAEAGCLLDLVETLI